MDATSAIDPQIRKPRMQDIAAQAQVSIGTVSRVLNGKPDVTAELAERVMRTAHAMGYGIRNSERQSSKRPGNLANIGYVVDAINESSIAKEPFQQNFLSGIEQTVTERGGHLLFSTCRNEVTKDALPAMIVENLVSGIILKASIDTPEAWIKKISDLIPVVLLMHRSIEHPLPSVMCDNRGAVFQSLRRLQDLGHTKIGFFFEDENSPSRKSLHHEERLDAFLKYAPLLGLNIRQEYVQGPSRNFAKGEDLNDVAHTALKNFLALGDQRPTAVICAADIYALTMIGVAKSHGLELPRDLSLIAMMNTQACEFSSPALSSVSLSEEEIGRAAVDLLEELIDRPLASVREVTIGTHLVERCSCAKPLAVQTSRQRISARKSAD